MMYAHTWTGARWRRGVFAAALLVSLGVPAATEQAEPDAGPVEVIEIRAERFSFTPSEIRVRAGTTVELRVRSDDTNHGFHILGTDTDILVPKRGRGVATVRFRAEAAGQYTFECSKLCGAGHSFMRGTLVVTE